MSGHDAFGRDENHQRKQENSSQHDEPLYLVLLNNIPAQVAAKDRDGRFVFVNNEYASLFGKSPDELLGKSVADFYPKEFAQDARMEDERLMRIGQVLEDVYEDHTACGSRRYFASRKGPIRNELGEVIGTQVICWDVTKRRIAELALLAEREELRATKQATDEAIHQINAFLKTAQQTLDELPAPLRKACECFESQLNGGGE